MTVEWPQQVGVVYSVTVLPWVPTIVTGNTSRQLTISYNSEYNVTVEAIINIASCRFSVSDFIILNYGEVCLMVMHIYKFIDHNNYCYFN